MTGARTLHVEQVMGTVVSLDLRGGGDHDSAVRALIAWFHEVDRRFSPYRSGSEVRRFERDPARPVSSDLAGIVVACDAVRDLSDGAFDAWRDGRFDPSAYVKGWSVDRAALLLAERGCADWSVNAGGDVLVRGTPGDGRAWRVGVRAPDDPGAVVAVVAGAAAVATSGAYERGEHIRRAAGADLVSVTVTGPTLGLADALSTAVFAEGRAGVPRIAALPGWECLAIAADGSALATRGFPRTVHGVPVTEAAA